MAAIGGDTVVPTNWRGLIGVAVLIGVLAAATYFGLTMSEGGTKVEKDDGLTVQEVFSSSARREVAAAEPVRALSRADFVAPAARSSTPNATDEEEADASDDMSMDEDWDAPAEVDESMETAAAAASERDAPAEPVAPEPTTAPAPRTSDSNRTTQSASTATTVREKEPELVDARTRPAAEALVAWWKEAGNGLQVRFAGTLDRGGKVSDGVAVMFGEAVAPAQADQYLQLTDASGQVVPGRWKTGANPTLLMMDGLAQGRYKLTIGAGLPGESGKTLAKTVSGPVFVY